MADVGPATVCVDAGRRPAPSKVSATVLWLGAAVLASGLLVAVVSAAGWSGAEILLPPVVALVLLAGALGGRRRGLAPALGVFAAATAGLWVVTVGLRAFEQTVAALPVALQILVVNGAKLVPLALVIAVLGVSRLGPASADLRVGSWRAATGLTIRGRSVDWRWVGGASALVLVGSIVAAGLGSYSSAGLWAAVLWLPVLGCAAVINSAAEEVIFRHAVNASTRALLRPAARVALTSTSFGLAHIHGTPSGAAGVVLTGALGVVLALAIEHTRGFCWNWSLHFVADLAIFATLVAATAPLA